MPIAEHSNRLTAGVLLAAGAIHLLPTVGAVSADALTRLYGVELVDPSVVLLLRHRAVLFGLLGVGLVIAALRQELRTAALAAALVSTVSFVALAGTSPARTPQIDRVILVDLIVAALLVVATAMRAWTRKRS